MHFSKIFKIKSGKLETFKNWMNELSTNRRDEAIATFDCEHVTREMFVLFQGNDGDHYVICLNEAVEIPGPSDPDIKINQEHKTIKKECLEVFSGGGEILLDLKK